MRTICKQILRDVKFMVDHNLMDYSLLLLTEENPDYDNGRNKLSQNELIDRFE